MDDEGDLMRKTYREMKLISVSLDVRESSICDMQLRIISECSSFLRVVSQLSALHLFTRPENFPVTRDFGARIGVLIPPMTVEMDAYNQVSNQCKDLADQLLAHPVYIPLTGSEDVSCMMRLLKHHPGREFFVGAEEGLDEDTIAVISDVFISSNFVGINEENPFIYQNLYALIRDGNGFSARVANFIECEQYEFHRDE